MATLEQTIDVIFATEDPIWKLFATNDADALRMARFHLEFLKVCYDIEPNPLLILRGWQTCRHANISAPDWVSEYVDRIALRLLGMVGQEGRTAGRVADALELPKSAFQRMATIEKEASIVSDLYAAAKADYLKRGTFKATALREEIAAKHRTSEPTVRRIQEKFEALISWYLSGEGESAT